MTIPDYLPVETTWTYYLVERGAHETEVSYAWHFATKKEVLRKLKQEASHHPDRTYQVYKCID